MKMEKQAYLSNCIFLVYFLLWFVIKTINLFFLHKQAWTSEIDRKSVFFMGYLMNPTLVKYYAETILNYAGQSIQK